MKGRCREFNRTENYDNDTKLPIRSPLKCINFLKILANASLSQLTTFPTCLHQHSNILLEPTEVPILKKDPFSQINSDHLLNEMFHDQQLDGENLHLHHVSMPLNHSVSTTTSSFTCLFSSFDALTWQRNPQSNISSSICVLDSSPHSVQELVFAGRQIQ